MHRAHGAQGRSSRTSCNLLCARAGLGRGQAASYGAPCTNQAAEFNSRRLKEQHKAKAGAPPMLIQPILELDQQRLISSKVSSICFSLYLSSHCGPPQCPGPPRRRHHPSKTTRHQVHLSRFQCGQHIQLNSYCMLSPVEDTSTTSRPLIQAP